MKKINERQRGMLRLIVRDGSRTLHSFTHGDSPCAPHVVEVYLNDLVARGLIVVTGKTYRPLPAGHEELDAQDEPVASRVFCNACMAPDSLRGANLPRMRSPRPNADQHLQYRSFGEGA